jgi:hypothetical protein
VKIANVGLNEFVVTGELDRLQRAGIEQSERKVLSQQGNNLRSDAPARAGDQNAISHRVKRQEARLGLSIREYRIHPAREERSGTGFFRQRFCLSRP